MSHLSFSSKVGLKSLLAPPRIWNMHFVQDGYQIQTEAIIFWARILALKCQDSPAHVLVAYNPPTMLTFKPTLVIIIWAYSPIPFKHKSVWY